MVGNGPQMGIFEPGYMGTQKRKEFPHLTASLNFCVGKICAGNGTFFDNPGGVEVNHIVRRHRKPENIFPGAVDAALRLNFIVNLVDLSPLRHDGTINMFQLETGCHRLAESVFIAEFKRRTRHYCKIAVPRGINKNFCPHSHKPGLGMEDRSNDFIPFFDHIKKRMVVKHLYARFQKKFFQRKSRFRFGNWTVRH